MRTSGALFLATCGLRGFQLGLEVSPHRLLRHLRPHDETLMLLTFITGVQEEGTGISHHTAYCCIVQNCTTTS